MPTKTCRVCKRTLDEKLFKAVEGGIGTTEWCLECINATKKLVETVTTPLGRHVATHKVCNTCLRELTMDGFTKNKQRPGGLSDKCKSCWSEEHALHVRTRKLSEIERQTALTAHAVANLHQKSGNISMPSRCEDCGIEGFLEKHLGDHNKPTEITWLCPTCHDRLHLSRRVRAGEALKHLVAKKLNELSETIESDTTASEPKRDVWGPVTSPESVIQAKHTQKDV